MSEGILPPGSVPPGEDPDLEARLVAMIAGEASAFEVEALERLMAARPEVAVMKRRLEEMHYLLWQSQNPGNESEWKLAPERRALVMKTLGIGGKGNGSNGDGEAKVERIRKMSRRALWAAAACIAVNAVLFVWLIGRMVKSEGMLSATGAEGSMRFYDSEDSPGRSKQAVRMDDRKEESLAQRSPVSRPVPPPVPQASKPAERLTGHSAFTAAPQPVEPPGDRAGEALAQLKSTLGDLPTDNTASSGLRSGDSAITRNSIDAILNKPAAPAGGAVLSSGRRIEADPANDDEVEIAEGGFLGDFSGVEAWGRREVQGGVYAGRSDGEVEEEAPSYPGGAVRLGAERGQEKRDKLSLAEEDAAIGSPLAGYLSSGNEGRAGRSLDHEVPPARGAIVDRLDAPVRTNPALTYENTESVDQVRRQLYTAEGYKDLGLYDNAIEEYQKALRVDPSNSAARRGMEGIQKLKSDYYRSAYDETRSRLLTEVDEAWEMAVPPAEGPAKGQSMAREQAATVQEKLSEIVIPEITIDDNTTLEEAVDFLRQRTRELDTGEADPLRKGMNFVIRKPRIDSGGAGVIDEELDAEGGLGVVDPGTARLKGMTLKNVTVDEALSMIADQAGMRYKVDDYAVTMLPRGGGEGDDIQPQTWKVGPTFLRDLQSASLGGVGADADADPFGGDSLGGGSLRARRPLIDILKDTGIDFPPGASAQFLPGSGTLVINNTPENLKLMDRVAKEILPKIPKTALDENLFKRRSGGERPVSEAEQLVASKLKNIVIPVIDFEDTTVEEAIDFLRQRSRELDSFETDPNMRGFGFRIRKPRVEGRAEELDAEGGLGAVDPGSAIVKELKLRNVPMDTALQYICDQAKMRYKITEEGVITLLPLGGGEGEELVTRTWEVHPDVMARVREFPGEDFGEADPFSGEPFTEREKAAQRQSWEDRSLMDVMKYTGIDFPPGASVLYRPDTKVLIVTNTPSNHDLVDMLFENVAVEMTTAKIEEETLETLASKEPFSTFSLNVSDVSFKLAKATLEKGEWPAPGQIRVEDFVNAFDYGAPAPSLDEKVACRMDQAAHPFMQQRNVVRISMRTAALGRAGGTPLRLTVLLDNSGSMERMDRAEAVRKAFDLLAAQLQEVDQVTLISFARTTRLLADRMTGDQAAQLSQLVDSTPSEGGTNLEQALRVGLAKAQEQKLEGAQNRIILLTDGAANLGNARAGDLAKLVEEMRQGGIAFDACGVGAEGLNDEILESLTRKGDGRYYLLDRPEDADAGFARQIAGALRPAAKNVKVQVEFNPQRVGRFKLYGFEKHLLEKEDFRNDSVDAAEMAAEESGNALYHYEALPEGEGEVGTVSVRFQDMATGRMVEKKWTIPYEARLPRLDEAEPAVQLAASAVFLGEKLNGSAIGERVELSIVGRILNGLQGVYPGSERLGEIREMTARAREMGE